MDTKIENKTSQEMDQYIQKRYNEAISYYWGASTTNKRWYKITRSLTVIIGSSVTLTAALASSQIILNDPTLKVIFQFGTPVLAAVLTIVAGFSQSFQWGSTWQNMILTAQQLQKDYDRYLVTPLDKRNFAEEADKLNYFVITESEGFFERMLGIAKTNEKTKEKTD